MGFGAGDSLYAGLNAFRDDPGNDEHVIHRDDPAQACQRRGIPCHPGVIRDQANGQDQHQGIHCNALVPAHHANRDVHDLAEEETAKRCDGNQDPGGEK